MLIRKFDSCFHVLPDAGGLNQEAFWSSVTSCGWEESTFEVLHKYLKPTSTYVDIGAWIGPTVLYASSLASKCYAFEPDPHAYLALRKNIDENPYLSTKITTFPFAVSDTAGTASLGVRETAGDSMSSLLWQTSNEKFDVKTVVLEDFLRQLSVSHIDFIKVDIEGGEELVLPSITHLLTSQKPTVYLAVHGPWLRDPRKFAYDLRVLSEYKHVYLSTHIGRDKLRKIKAGDLSDCTTQFCNVLASDIEMEDTCE